MNQRPHYGGNVVHLRLDVASNAATLMLIALLARAEWRAAAENAQLPG